MVDVNGIGNVYNVEELTSKSNKELKAIASDLGCVGYSKLNKTNLIEMIVDKYTAILNEKTANELRDIAKGLGYTGISKTNKSNLITLILEYSDEEDDEEDSIDLSSGTIMTETDEAGVIGGDSSYNPASDNSNPTDITVIYTAKTRHVPYEKKNIWEIHADLASTMGLPSKPTFTVNDADVPNTYVPVVGDVVEFFRDGSGNKG